MMVDWISRRLAIKTALEFFIEYYGGAFREDEQRLLAERIDALPSVQPKIKTDGDTISRQKALDIVRDVCDAIMSGCDSHYDGEDEVYDDLSEVNAILKCNKEIRIALGNMPSAQPERKTGQWISMTSYSNSYKCSVCGRMLINITDGKNTVTKNYPYCHCGAKMLKTEN